MVFDADWNPRPVIGWGLTAKGRMERGLHEALGLMDVPFDAIAAQRHTIRHMVARPAS